MYKRQLAKQTTLSVNTQYEGESIEQKIDRIVNNNEAITDGAPLIYTNRKDGVLPDYDIRTDRFEIAIDAMDKVTKSHLASREERAKLTDEGKTNTKKDGGAEPIPGTDGTGGSK